MTSHVAHLVVERRPGDLPTTEAEQDELDERARCDIGHPLPITLPGRNGQDDAALVVVPEVLRPPLSPPGFPQRPRTSSTAISTCAPVAGAASARPPIAEALALVALARRRRLDGGAAVLRPDRVDRGVQALAAVVAEERELPAELGVLEVRERHADE